VGRLGKPTETSRKEAHTMILSSHAVVSSRPFEAMTSRFVIVERSRLLVSRDLRGH
jgi:hypothetical protein